MQDTNPDHDDAIEAESALRDPKAALRATERLEAAATEHAALASMVLDDILRIVPEKRAIFTGTLHGQNAVFRLALCDAERRQSAEQWAELSRIYPYMNAGAYRVAEPLFFDEADGITAISHAAGRPLMMHLWSLPRDARLPHIAQSAGWLAQYCASSTAWRGVDWRNWARRCEKAAAQQHFTRLQNIESKILQKTKKLGRMIKEMEWRVAVCHGDFHPLNLIIAPDETRLTGLDLGSSFLMPIYRDIARYLIYNARRHMWAGDGRRYGVDGAAIDAFADAFAMSADEKRYFIPYMIAVETLTRVESKTEVTTRLNNSVELAEALFEDLRELTL